MNSYKPKIKYKMTISGELFPSQLNANILVAGASIVIHFKHNEQSYSVLVKNEENRCMIKDVGYNIENEIRRGINLL